MSSEDVDALHGMVAVASRLDVLAKLAAACKQSGSSATLPSAQWPAQWRKLPGVAGAAWDAVLAWCDRWIGLDQRRVESGAEAATVKAHVQAIVESQTRLRENIKALEKMPESPLMTRYMTDLDHEEDELIAARKQLTQLAKVRDRNMVIRLLKVLLFAKGSLQEGQFNN